MLQLFCYAENRSITEISGQLNLMGVKMAYKNVHKRIRELESLNLIQKDGSISKHGAIYYRLTSEGIYILFLERPDGIIFNEYEISTKGKSVSNTRNFLNNYGNDILFKSFLYPFFNKETLDRIEYVFLWNIYDYLHDCCKELQSIIDRKDLAYYEKRFSWNAVPGEDSKTLLQLLKETLHLAGDINNVNIMKSPDDKFITFLNNTELSTIILELDRQHNRVLVKDDATNVQRCEYDVLQINSNVDVCIRLMPQDSMAELNKRTKIHLEFLAYRLINSLGSLTSREQESIIEALHSDSKFMAIISTLQDRFLRGLNLIKQNEIIH